MNPYLTLATRSHLAERDEYIWALEMQTFDPAQDVFVIHRRLPHWSQPGTITFITDFEFFESRRDLDSLVVSLAYQNARFLGAAHGRYNKQTADHFQAALGGQIIKLRNLDAVPGLLMDAIRIA